MKGLGYFTWGFLIGMLFVGELYTIKAHAGEQPKVTESGQFAPSEMPVILNSFLVTQCDEVVVVFVELADGSVRRTDAINHPNAEDYELFLKWLKTAPEYKYAMPCLTAPKKDAK